MPRFITSGALGTMKSSYATTLPYRQPHYNYSVQNPYTYDVYNSKCTVLNEDIPDTPNTTIDKQTVFFLDTLAEKLIQLTQAFEARIEDVKKNCKEVPKNSYNPIIASIDTPIMDISVGVEFLIYVQRYGPPPLGKFDPEKIAFLRAELAAAG